MDDLQDAAAKGRCRGKASTGSDNPASKLTPELVREARRIYAGRLMTQRELADILGVSHSTVGDFLRRETWRHV